MNKMHLLKLKLMSVLVIVLATFIALSTTVFAVDEIGDIEIGDEPTVTEIEDEESTIIPKDLEEPVVLLEQYIEETAPAIVQEAMMGGASAEEDSVLPPKYARYWKLGEAERNAYLMIKERLELIAAGQESSVEVTLSFSDVFPQEKLDKQYSASDLGVDSLVYLDNNGTYDFTEKTFELLKGEYVLDTTKLFNALIADFPSLLYWFDKTIGLSTSTSYDYDYDYFSDNNNLEFTIWFTGDSVFSFYFTASMDYAAAGQEPGTLDLYAVDTSKTSSVSTAIENAALIVADSAANSDYEKLEDYKDTICNLVSYDHNAPSLLNTNAIGYGNPWQLIYVFDEVDPTVAHTTNVVCEGYAKAFKFLCDLTEFDNNTIAAHIVTGDMDGGTGAGGHMWNVVTIDGFNYLVDVTNCDTGSVGAPDLLFMVGNTNATTTQVTKKGKTATAERYTFDLNPVITFTYDYDTVTSFDETERQLATNDYTPCSHEWGDGVVTTPAKCEVPGVRTFTCSTCGATRTEEIAALVHDYQEVPNSASPATCAAEGKEADQKCKHCNIVITGATISKLEHSWNSGVETKAPSCGVKGETTFTCSSCGATRIEEIEALEHNWGKWTSSDETQHQRTCSHDPNHKEIEAHTWDNGELTLEPSIGEAGIREYTCTVCEWKKQEEIPAIVLIDHMDIGNVWTTLSPNNGVAFTTAFDPDGVLDNQMEFADQYWKDETTGAEIHIKENKLPLVGHTYRFFVVITPKDGYAFDEAAFDEFIYGGNPAPEYTKTLNADGSITLEWGLTRTVAADNLTDSEYETTVSGIATKTYTGAAQTQSPTVKVRVKGEWKALVNGADYSLSYKNNMNAGTATVTITGKGGFTGSISKTFKINKAVTKVSVPSGKTFTYNGKQLTGVAGGSNYTLSGTVKATKAGSYTAKATLKANANYSYKWADGTTAAKNIKWTINKAVNPLTIQAKTANLAFTAVKSKNQTLAATKLITFSKKGQGTVTYVKASGNKNITIDKKTGAVTVKKGLKKGTYKVKVKVTAAGNANYNKVTRTVTFTIKVN